MSGCFQCYIERRNCRAKRRWADLETANTEAQERNIATSWLLRLVAYKCPWCDGYHLTKAKGKARLKRVEGRRRKWLAAQQEVDAS